VGQAASILFAKTMGTGSGAGEFLVLGSINEMRFLKPVVPGDRLEMDVKVLKFIDNFAVVETVAIVNGVEVAKGKLSFARKSLEAPSA
jgi:3-hydroxymyristoyl/3-hydroxydecanoyl-(acyl carrier protein) dehydratase